LTWRLSYQRCIFLGVLARVEATADAIEEGGHAGALLGQEAAGYGPCLHCLILRSWSPPCLVPMLGQNVFIWNVRDLNSRTRCDVVCESLLQEHVSVACLVKTKLDVLLLPLANDLMGTSFDYVCLPASGALGVSCWLGLTIHGQSHGKLRDVSRSPSTFSRCAQPRRLGRSWPSMVRSMKV
jgi:hypothetical protein